MDKQERLYHFDYTEYRYTVKAVPCWFYCWSRPYVPSIV